MNPEENLQEPKPDTPKIVGYCRACGTPLDQTTVRDANGTIYCQEHIPVQQPAAPPLPPRPALGPVPEPPYTSPYTGAVPPPAVDHQASPGLAFILGLIPGVGAIYNGQYAKGLIHVIIIGLAITILSSNEGVHGFEPLFAMMLVGFWFYMAFEAYHTARRRQLGLGVDEFSSLVPARGASKFPVAPVLLIVLGVIFLLHNLDFLQIERIIRFWPVLLIALGVYMLFNRLTNASHKGDAQ